MNKIKLNRPIEEFNNMTLRDALEELESWDFLDILGSDAERLSDAIKRIRTLVEEVKLQINPNNHLAILNEKIGIHCWCNTNLEGKMKEIHFTDSNGREFEAFIGEIIEEHQDDLDESIEILSCLQNTDELINYFDDLGLQHKCSNFEEDSILSPIFQFHDFKIQVFY